MVMETELEIVGNSRANTHGRQLGCLADYVGRRLPAVWSHSWRQGPLHFMVCRDHHSLCPYAYRVADLGLQLSCTGCCWRTHPQTIIIFVRPRRHAWGARLSKRIAGAVFGSRRHLHNGPNQQGVHEGQQQKQQQQEAARDNTMQRGMRGGGAAASAAAAAMSCTPFGAAKLRPSEGSSAGPILASHALQSDVVQQQQQQRAKDVEAGGQRDQKRVQEQRQDREEGGELGASDAEEGTERDGGGGGGGDGYGDSTSSTDGNEPEGGAAAGGQEGWFGDARRRAVEGVRGVWRRFWRSIRETEDFRWVLGIGLQQHVHSSAARLVELGHGRPRGATGAAVRQRPQALGHTRVSTGTTAGGAAGGLLSATPANTRRHTC